MEDRVTVTQIREMDECAERVRKNWQDANGAWTADTIRKISLASQQLDRRSVDVLAECSGIDKVCREILGDDAPQDQQLRLTRSRF